ATGRVQLRRGRYRVRDVRRIHRCQDLRACQAPTAGAAPEGARAGGGPVVDENQSFLSQIEYAGGPLQGMSPHHRCVGGKSLFWGGWAPPLMNDDEQDDLAQWPHEIRDFLLSPQGY